MSHWALAATLAALAGVIVGSFLNVVIARGPVLWRLVGRPDWLEDDARYDLALPRSHCPACGAPIRIADLVPIVSYVARRGRCAACNAPISPRYPVVEALTGLAAAWAVWASGVSWDALWWFALWAILIASSAIDLELRYLPDALVLPLVWLGLLANLTARFAPLSEAVLGAVAGYLAFRTTEEIYRFLRKRDGLGRGDAKLLAALGAWFGWAALPLIVLSGAVIALAFAAPLVLRKRVDASATPVPFGPALAAGAFVYANLKIFGFAL